MNPAERPHVDGQRAGPFGAAVPLGRWVGVPIAAHWSTVAARHYGMRIKRITLWMLGGLTELPVGCSVPRWSGWAWSR